MSKYYDEGEVESPVDLNNNVLSDWQSFSCPNCGHDCLHINEGIKLEESYGGYAISMWCEGCTADIVLEILSHKGSTYAKMFHVKNGRASELRKADWERAA